MKLFHPLPLFVYSAGLITMNLIFTHPVFHVIICLFTFFLAFVFVGAAKLWRLIKYGISIGAFALIFNVLTNHRGSFIFFYFLGNPITLEAAIYGFYIMTLITSMMLGFALFNYFIDKAAFLYLFSFLSPKIVLVLHLSLRFTEVFGQKALEFIEIQQVRRQTPISMAKNLKARLSNSATLLTMLTSRNLEESMESAIILKAKGYGNSKRSSYNYYRFKRADCVFLIILIILIGALIAARMAGIGLYTIYPRIELPGITLTSWVFAGLLALFLAAPILVELLS